MRVQVPLPDKGARVAIVQKKLRRVQGELREQRPAWARKEFVPRVWFDMSARTTLAPDAPGMPPLADLCATVCLSEVCAPSNHLHSRPPAMEMYAAVGLGCVVGKPPQNST